MHAWNMHVIAIETCLYSYFLAHFLPGSLWWDLLDVVKPHLVRAESDCQIYLQTQIPWQLPTARSHVGSDWDCVVTNRRWYG